MKHLWSTTVWQVQSVAALFPHIKVCLRCGRNENILYGESLNEGEDCEYIPYLPAPVKHEYRMRLVVPPGLAREIESLFNKGESC